MTGLVILFIALLTGCSEKIADSNSNTVTVKMQAPITSTGTSAMVNLFVLTVSAPDMEPLTAFQWYEGGPLVFELDVPAGSHRLFVLEGISAGPEFDFTSPLQDVIYRGSATADIEPGVSVDLAIQLLPVVPLFRVNPYLTQVESGQPFELTVEAFNLTALKDAEIRLLFDPDIIAVDSFAKGATLDASDVIEVAVGSNEPGLQLLISDPNVSTGSIVDANGHSDMITLYMRSLVTLEEGARYVDIAPLTLTQTSGDSIPVAGVYSQAATVDIGPFTQPLLRFTPSTVDVESPESFVVDVEMVNFAGLSSGSFTLFYDYLLIMPDSVVKGADLASTDNIRTIMGETQLFIEVSNSTETVIDTDLPTEVATLYFTLPYIFNGASDPDGTIIVQTSTQIVFQPGSFDNLDGSTIAADDVTTQPGTIYITPIADSIVTFPDAGLDALIRNTIGDNTTDPLWLSDVIYISWLDAGGGDINVASLEGIQVLENLWTLDLDGCSVSDLAPLAGLTNLRNLYLRGNLITDISPLSGLTNLDALDLSNSPEAAGNSISDLSTLASLTQLTYLNAGWNSGITDASPLSSLVNLTYINLEWCHLSSVVPFYALYELDYLYLDGNDISDLTPLLDNFGLGDGGILSVTSNPLSPYEEQCYTIIPLLENMGMTVYSDCAF